MDLEVNSQNITSVYSSSDKQSFYWNWKYDWFRSKNMVYTLVRKNKSPI